MTQNEIRYHPIVAALYDPAQLYFERLQGPEHREYLARGLDGRILEIAVGTGAMIPYYERQVGDGAVVHGVEPDPGMWSQAREKLEDSDCSMRLVSARGEALPYPDGAFDHVIDSGLLCSVPSVDAALAEIRRVLAPDGEYRFLDHVRSDGIVGRSQDVLTPLWRWTFGNCHLNRRLQPALEESERFRIEEIARVSAGHWPVREFLRGTAIAAG